MKHFLKFVWGIAAVALISCGDDVPPYDSGKAYFPLFKGFYQVYDVEETVYTLGVPTTTRYELKTEVADSFLTADNDYQYVIYRSKRATGATTWNYLDTWSARVTDREVVVQEQNTAYLKLILPAKDATTWNGNTYNSAEEDDYTYADVKKEQVIDGDTYADCVTVLQNDNQDFVVYLDQRKELYARNAGLAYKQTTQLHYCTSNDCLGQQKVESGLILTQSLKEYGKAR